MVRAVCQNKVVAVFVPVVFIVIEGEAGLLFHAQHAGKLEITALIRVAARLTNADQSAAAPHKAPDGRRDRRVFPNEAAGMRRVAIADIQKHIYAIQHLGVGLDVVKADELHIERRTGQCFDDACIAVILLLVQGMVHHVAAPCAGLAPAVQHGNGLAAIGRCALDVRIQLAEFIADAFHIGQKLRELAG